MTHEGARVAGFSDAQKIGVVGDTHGDMGHLLQAAKTFADRGVTTLLQLGDFGFIWPGQNWNVTLDRLDRRLARLGSTIYFLLGNHDPYPLMNEFSVGSDGLQWVRGNLACIPRGWGTVIGNKYTFAALGGANSIDRQFRIPGRDWWPEEQITETDLARLGDDDSDVLAGHEAPLFVPSLDRHLTTLPRWPAEADSYANESRRMFHRAVLQTRPQLTLGAHYHHFIDETVTFSDGEVEFPCRVVVLDKNGPGVSLAILHTRTLDLTFLHRNGAVAEH
jgi:3',5'-cyclic AMP phosphodiesterase CpdA